MMMTMRTRSEGRGERGRREGARFRSDQKGSARHRMDRLLVGWMPCRVCTGVIRRAGRWLAAVADRGSQSRAPSKATLQQAIAAAKRERGGNLTNKQPLPCTKRTSSRQQGHDSARAPWLPPPACASLQQRDACLLRRPAAVSIQSSSRALSRSSAASQLAAG
jgi:hypothetical protein